MAPSATLESERDFHLAGLLLMIAAVVLGLTVAIGAFLVEKERRVAEQSALAAAAAAAAPVTKPEAGPAAEAPAVTAPAPAAAAPIASGAAQAASGTGNAAAGKTAFAAMCGACHPNGQAGLGPALVGIPEDRMKAAVRQGTGVMPAFGAGQVSDEQLANMLAYLGSL